MLTSAWVMAGGAHRAARQGANQLAGAGAVVPSWLLSGSALSTRRAPASLGPSDLCQGICHCRYFFMRPRSYRDGFGSFCFSPFFNVVQACSRLGPKTCPLSEKWEKCSKNGHLSKFESFRCESPQVTRSIPWQDHCTGCCDTRRVCICLLPGDATMA